jgi:hypothetical protein
MRAALIAVLVLLLAAPGSLAGEFVANESHFQCLLDGVKPEGRDFYVFHRNRRRLRKAVRVARRGQPGKDYPVGTILQLFPFEAMVKRGKRYNPEGNGWEFFQLVPRADGTTTIASRGAGEVQNVIGSCQGCHKNVAADFDLVCETAVGRGGLGLSPEQVAALQAGDPRCR